MHGADGPGEQSSWSSGARPVNGPARLAFRPKFLLGGSRTIARGGWVSACFGWMVGDYGSSGACAARSSARAWRGVGWASLSKVALAWGSRIVLRVSGGSIPDGGGPAAPRRSPAGSNAASWGRRHCRGTPGGAPALCRVPSAGATSPQYHLHLRRCPVGDREPAVLMAQGQVPGPGDRTSAGRRKPRPFGDRGSFLRDPWQAGRCTDRGTCHC